MKNNLANIIDSVNEKIDVVNEELSLLNLGNMARIETRSINSMNKKFLLDLIDVKRKAIALNKDALDLKREIIKDTGQEIIEILLEAGKVALAEQQKLGIETKADGTLLSSGDIAVNNFLFDKFKHISNHILSEENYNLKEINKNDLVLVIDPIDGTESYTKKENTWSILVALVENNKTLFSAVYQVAEDKLFYAYYQKGAYLLSNGQTKALKIDSTADKAVISPSLIESEINLLKNYTEEYYILPSAGLKIMEVVMNKAIIYPNHAKKCGIWDLLAPVLILEEAGGIIELDKELSLSQPKIDFNFIVKGLK